jgi:uncharacterized RDD family membrane protein YckC
VSARADARVAALASPPVIAVPSATGVDAQVVLAGPGARTIAFLIDWLIRGGLALAWLLIAALLILGNVDFQVPEEHETLWYLAGAIPATAIYFLYHPVLEPLMSGRTPGKRMTGLRVLTPEGVVPGAGALVTRNLFRIIDSMPALYVVGLLFVIFGRRHLRLGDMAAGTVLAVERAPFLERLEAANAASSNHAAPQAARRRALALGRRRGSDVHEALAVVEDYRQTARALAAARAGAGDEYLEAAYADLHDVIHRPARRLRDVLLSLMRDRVPATMRAMRHHTLGVTMLFVISATAFRTSSPCSPARSSSPPSSAASCGPKAC